jgi:hypothetical protein
MTSQTDKRGSVESLTSIPVPNSVPFCGRGRGFGSLVLEDRWWLPGAGGGWSRFLRTQSRDRGENGRVRSWSRSPTYATALFGREAEERSNDAFGGKIGRIECVPASACVRSVLVVIVGAVAWADSAWKGTLVGVVDLEDESGKGKKAAFGAGDEAAALAASAMDTAR